MKKILITGTTGMLGSDLVRFFVSKGNYEVYGLGRRLTPLLPAQNQIVANLEDQIQSGSFDLIPDIIIHAAALTDLNLCELEPNLSEKINVGGSKAVAKLAGENTKLFYISTDSVFDGIKGNYKENDLPKPLNEYAKSKLNGEYAFKNNSKGEVIILRTNIYGFHVPMSKSLAEWAYGEWRKERVISGFTDTIFNAVFTHQLASVIEFMIDSNIFSSILNVGSSEFISKFDFLNRFRKILGVSNTLLLPALSTDFPSSIQRPINTSLDVSHLSSFYKVPDFENGLQDWVNYNHDLNKISFA